MKVLQINSVCGIRSTGRICTDIAEVLERAGHECKIAYGREIVPAQYQKYAVRIGSDLDVKLHGLRARLFDAMGFGSKRATKKFIEWVRAYDPDVIHLHNIHGYYINIKVLFHYLREAGKPVIWTLHDCWAFTGHCVHFDWIGCEKWKCGACAHCSKRSGYPKSLFLDRSARNFKKKRELFCGVPDLTLVTPSKWLADLAQKSFFEGSPIKVIHNGIDTGVFKPTESDFRAKNGLENAVIVLGVASAWSESKGLSDFVRLSSLLGETHKIVLVGLTEAQKAALPPEILGITRTNNTKELAEIYTAADVFVNPTYQETFGMVNLEAQACGTPVITYHTGGTPETLDSNSGILVKKGDIEAVARILQSGTPRTVQACADWDKNRCFAADVNLYEEVGRV